MSIKLCQDIDLVKWEPVLFRDAYLPSQTLAQGQDGTVAAGLFTAADSGFISGGVQPGHVLYLDSSTATTTVAPQGCFEIVTVDSEEQLTISRLRGGVSDEVLPPPAGSSIDYRVSTFDPQTEEASYSLLQYFGLDEADAANIINQRVLRQATVFAVLAAVFTAAACGEKDENGFWHKARQYRQMFTEARVKARPALDNDGDTRADEFHSGGAIRLRRV